MLSTCGACRKTAKGAKRARALAGLVWQDSGRTDQERVLNLSVPNKEWTTKSNQHKTTSNTYITNIINNSNTFECSESVAHTTRGRALGGGGLRSCAGRACRVLAEDEQEIYD